METDHCHNEISDPIQVILKTRYRLQYYTSIYIYMCIYIYIWKTYIYIYTYCFWLVSLNSTAGICSTCIYIYIYIIFLQLLSFSEPIGFISILRQRILIAHRRSETACCWCTSSKRSRPQAATAPSWRCSTLTPLVCVCVHKSWGSSGGQTNVIPRAFKV